MDDAREYLVRADIVFTNGVEKTVFQKVEEPISLIELKDYLEQVVSTIAKIYTSNGTGNLRFSNSIVAIQHTCVIDVYIVDRFGMRIFPKTGMLKS